MEGSKPVRLAYKTFEPDTGADESLAPIVYLHGMAASKEYWFDIPQKVADATKRKSYAVDARNHGDSEWSDYFNFDVNVDDLVHLLDTLGIQKAVLVGHSMGGVTCVKAALNKPERVESIIVEDMGVRKIPEDLLGHMLSMARLMRPALEIVPSELDNTETIKFLFKYVVDNADPELKELMEKSMQHQNVEDYAILLKRDSDGRATLGYNNDVVEKAIANYNTFASESEGLFDGPAFFLCGTHSPFKVAEDKDHIKQFFPNAVFECFETDHCIHLPKRTEFTDAVLKCLA